VRPKAKLLEGAGTVPALVELVDVIG